MGSIVEFLKGKKTYLQAGVAGIVVILFALGILDGQTATVILGLAGAGSIASLGAKIDRTAPPKA